MASSTISLTNRMSHQCKHSAGWIIHNIVDYISTPQDNHELCLEKLRDVMVCMITEYYDIEKFYDTDTTGELGTGTNYPISLYDKYYKIFEELLWEKLEHEGLTLGRENAPSNVGHFREWVKGEFNKHQVAFVASTDPDYLEQFADHYGEEGTNYNMFMDLIYEAHNEFPEMEDSIMYVSEFMLD